MLRQEAIAENRLSSTRSPDTKFGGLSLFPGRIHCTGDPAGICGRRFGSHRVACPHEAPDCMAGGAVAADADWGYRSLVHTWEEANLPRSSSGTTSGFLRIRPSGNGSRRRGWGWATIRPQDDRRRARYRGHTLPPGLCPATAPLVISALCHVSEMTRCHVGWRRWRLGGAIRPRVCSAP